MKNKEVEVRFWIHFLLRTSFFCFCLISFLCHISAFAADETTITGNIQRIDDNQAIILLGEKDGIRKGATGEIFREEDDSVLPIAELIVTKVYPDSARIEIHKRMSTIYLTDTISVAAGGGFSGVDRMKEIITNKWFLTGVGGVVTTVIAVSAGGEETEPQPTDGFIGVTVIFP
jgi:hypothetical protein